MLLMACLPVPAVAATDTLVSKVPDTFVKQLVAGINARDIDKLRPIMHPATLKCVTPETQDYYAWWLWKDGSKSYTITPGYTIRIENPVDVPRSEAAMAAVPFITKHWPVQPDTGLSILYHAAPKSIIVRPFQITLNEGKAELVIACPTQLGLESFHEKMVLTAAQKRKLENLWKNANDTDRRAMQQMARNGKKIDGMNLAEQKYHLNTTDALALMDMIEYADTP